jgi:hypothetical protein
MTKAEMRRLAIGAIRSEARRQGVAPESLSADAALRMLDDLYRIDPEIIASIWYGEASDNQITLFKQEWRRWQHA